MDFLPTPEIFFMICFSLLFYFFLKLLWKKSIFVLHFKRAGFLVLWHGLPLCLKLFWAMLFGFSSFSCSQSFQHFASFFQNSRNETQKGVVVFVLSSSLCVRFFSVLDSNLLKNWFTSVWWSCFWELSRSCSFWSSLKCLVESVGSFTFWFRFSWRSTFRVYYDEVISAGFDWL